MDCRAFVALTVCVVLSGCAARKPAPPTVVRVVEQVEVKVPISVPVRRVPPPELYAAFVMPLPVFVTPEHPEASSALTAEGERLLRGLIEDLLTRLAAWQAWAAQE